MRYFISIDVENERVKDSLVNFTEEIGRLGDMKLVRPENLHLTLLFLGERQEVGADELRETFIRSCEEISVGEFECRVSGVGVFPHMNYIKTVWAATKPREKLQKVHMKFSEVMNVESEGNFVPHITVGRLRNVSGEEKSVLQEKIRGDGRDFGSFQVENVRLKESELGPEGPTYRDLEVCGL